MIEKIGFSKYVESRNTHGYMDTNTYNVTIRYNGKQYTTTYTCSCHEIVKKINVLDCLLMDADSYDCYDCIEDFASDMSWDWYDYEDRKQANKVWNSCKRTSKALHRMFTTDEIMELIDDING